MNSQDTKDLWTRIAENMESDHPEEFSHSSDDGLAYQDACLIWKLCSEMPKIPSDVNAALAGIHQKIARTPTQPFMQVVASKKAWWKSAYAIAASVALVMVTTVSVYTLITSKSTDTLAHSAISYQTANAEKKEVTLPDGSIVLLNADTRLVLDAGFGASSRKLTLSGEAYFQVTSNPAKPFIITTTYSKTEVVGTAFNLKAYPNDTKVALDVREGKVKFGSAQTTDLMLVTASQGAVLDAVSQTVTPTESTDNLTWKDGVISFKDESLVNVAAYLSRWYDVTVSVDELIKSKKLTGQFQNKSIAEVLDYIKLALDIDYTIEGKEYKLLPKKK